MAFLLYLPRWFLPKPDLFFYIFCHINFNPNVDFDLFLIYEVTSVDKQRAFSLKRRLSLTLTSFDIVRALK